MITAILKRVDQVGPNDWHTYRWSRNFDENRPIKDILNWANSMLGCKETKITDIEFADYTGDSI